MEERAYGQALETNNILYNYLWSLYSEGSKYFSGNKKSRLVELMGCVAHDGVTIKAHEVNFTGVRNK